MDPTASGRALHLQDVFSAAGTWTEQRYSVADKSNVFAIGAEVDCSYSSTSESTTWLELRPANRFSTLTFKVGQAIDSKASDKNLTVDVIANGSANGPAKLDNRSIPFNAIQDFEVDIRGVGAVRLDFSVPCGNDNLSVVAVVQDLVVTNG